jgi:hypothetical protein
LVSVGLTLDIPKELTGENIKLKEQLEILLRKDFEPSLESMPG